VSLLRSPVGFASIANTVRPTPITCTRSRETAHGAGRLRGALRASATFMTRRSRQAEFDRMDRVPQPGGERAKMFCSFACCGQHRRSRVSSGLRDAFDSAPGFTELTRRGRHARRTGATEAPAQPRGFAWGGDHWGTAPGVDNGALEQDDVSLYLHFGRGCTTRARLRKLFDTKTKF
jgi:hypothetical protein